MIALAQSASVGAADGDRLHQAAQIPSPNEGARISKPYSDCLQAAAERYDDGRSDIAVIGKAVASACKAEFYQMAAGLGEHLSSDDRQALCTKLSDMQIGYATWRSAKSGEGMSITKAA